MIRENNKNIDNYYTTKEMAEIFRKNGIDTDNYCNSFRAAISRFDSKLEKKISKKIGQHICYSKEFIDSIDFDYLTMLKDIHCKTIFINYLNYQIYGEATIDVASRILGCSRSTLDNVVQEKNDIFTEVIREGYRYVKVEEVLKWKEFKELVVDSDNLIERINKEINQERKNYRLYYYKKIYEIYKECKFDEFVMVPAINTPFRTLGNKKIYIKKEYEEEVYQILKQKELSNNVYYYTTREMAEIFRKNGIDTDDHCLSFRVALSKSDSKLEQKISKKEGHNVWYSKEFVEAINFDYLRILKQINNGHIFKQYMEYETYGETTTGVACSILGCHPDTLNKILKEDNDILTEVIRNGCRYVKVEEVLKWKEFKESVVSLRDIVSRVNRDIDESGNCHGLIYNREVLKMYKDGVFNKFEIVPEGDTPFRALGNKQFYVKKEYEDEIYKILREKLLNKVTYYTTREVSNIFKENGIDVSCKVFRSDLLDYDYELYKKVVISDNGTFKYSKEFINGLDFDYLRKLKETKGTGLFKQLLIYQFSDELEYYSIKELKKVFDENGVEIDQYCAKFRSALKKYYSDFNDKVSIMVNQQVHYSKNFIDSIDFDFLRQLQSLNYRNIYKIYMDYHIYGEVTIFIASNMLGCSASTLYSVAEEDNDIINEIVRDGVRYVKFETVLKWKEFKDSMIGLNNIIERVKKEIGEEKRGGRLYYIHKIYEMYEDGIFDKFSIVKESDTPFRTPGNREFYVKKEYENEIYQTLKEKLTSKIINSFGSKVDKFKHKFECIDIKDKEYTFKEFSAFAIHRISTLSKATVCTYIYIAENMEKLKKEITECTTEEIDNILKCLKTKKSKSEFIFFVNQVKKKNKTKYSYVGYDPNHETFKRDIKPYTQEQYIRFGFLVWSDSHIWYKSYMEKALSKRAYASTWLYAALHYVCAWRLGDLLKQFPRPNIHMDPKTFLEKVKNKELKEEIALDIIEQVNLKIELEEINPSKTSNYNPPDLVLQIPESIYVFLGTLIGIAEAHYQLSHHPGKKGIISEICKRRKVQVEFFGEEFVEIFGKDSFSNLRANKNYEILMTRKGDEKKLGTGYLLASIARSHKYTVDELSETTNIYLEYYKDMEDGEILLRELFERGVCSFAPYLLTKIVAGKDVINKLSQEERTKKIKEIAPIDAYNTEILLQSYDDGLDNARRVVKELLIDAVEKGLNPKEVAKRSLERISYNEATAKQDKLDCMLIAQGKGCRYPKRKDCVGCGYEIYVKSCLSELGNRIEKAQQQAVSSKTQGSKNKNILMIKDVLIPIASEILITLKNVYKIENIDEYKKFIQLRGE